MPNAATLTASRRIIVRMPARPMPMARSTPISRVRSETDMARVLTMPSEEIRTPMASSPYISVIRLPMAPAAFTDELLAVLDLQQRAVAHGGAQPVLGAFEMAPPSVRTRRRCTESGM